MVRRKPDSRSSSELGKPEKFRTNVIVSRNRRNRQQARALQEIKYYRNTVNLLIPKAPFVRLVRQILGELFPTQGIERIQITALQALQEATEAYIVQFFEDCMLLTYHTKRATLMKHDMILLRRLRGRSDIVNK